MPLLLLLLQLQLLYNVGTSTAGTSTAGTPTAGTSTAGTPTAGTSTAGTSTAGTHSYISKAKPLANDTVVLHAGSSCVGTAVLPSVGAGGLPVLLMGSRCPHCCRGAAHQMVFIIAVPMYRKHPSSTQASCDITISNKHSFLGVKHFEQRALAIIVRQALTKFYYIEQIGARTIALEAHEEKPAHVRSGSLQLFDIFAEGEIRMPDGGLHRRAESSQSL